MSHFVWKEEIFFDFRIRAFQRIAIQLTPSIKRNGLYREIINIENYKHNKVHKKDLSLLRIYLLAKKSFLKIFLFTALDIVTI